MDSCKTLALAEFPLKRDVATDCRSQGPMSQQLTDGSGRDELHPQKMMQLVGFRDPNARKHEELHRPQQSSLLQVHWDKPQPNLRPSAFGFWRWIRTRETLSASR